MGGLSKNAKSLFIVKLKVQSVPLKNHEQQSTWTDESILNYVVSLVSPSTYHVIHQTSWISVLVKLAVSSDGGSWACLEVFRSWAV